MVSLILLGRKFFTLDKAKTALDALFLTTLRWWYFISLFLVSPGKNEKFKFLFVRKCSFKLKWHTFNMKIMPRNIFFSVQCTFRIFSSTKSFNLKIQYVSIIFFSFYFLYSSIFFDAWKIIYNPALDIFTFNTCTLSFCAFTARSTVYPGTWILHIVQAVLDLCIF